MDRPDSLAGFFRSANGVSAFKAAFSPLRNAFKRMPFKVLQRQHFAGRLSEFHGAESDKEDGKIHYHLDNDHDDSGYDTDLASIYKFHDVLCWSRMNINFQTPTECQQHKDPKVVGPETLSDRFPLADSKMGRCKVSGDVVGPLLIRRRRAAGKHRRKITRREYADTICPDLVISIAPRLHKKKDGNKHRIDRNGKMRVAR